MFSKNYKNKYKRGVTLIELMVVIVIFMILTGITIFSYGKFNSSMSIQNLADDVSLAIRRAQGYAIGVKNYGTGFATGYGVHFSANGANISSLYKGSTKSFILFADLSDDKSYDDAGICGTLSQTNECLEILSITSADQISLISYTSSGVQNDAPLSSSLDIMFKRPTPEPYFCYRVNYASNPTGNCDSISSTISSIRIKVISPNNLNSYKIITVSNNGQISVSNT